MKAFLIILVITLMVSALHADSLSVASGNCPVGELDPFVSVFGSSVTIQGMAYPSAGVALQQATVLSPHPDWVALAGSSWVGVPGGNTSAPNGGYIYRSCFELPSGHSNPIISLTMSSDNASTAYLNGHVLGSTDPVAGEFRYLFTLNSSDSSAFRAGSNVLEFHVANGYMPSANPSGLIFQARVSYTPEIVPEPSSLLALGSGLLALDGLIRRRR